MYIPKILPVFSFNIREFITANIGYIPTSKADVETATLLEELPSEALISVGKYLT